MNQKTKYIILNLVSLSIILLYVWIDQNIQNNFDHKQKELDDLNRQLIAGDASLNDIQKIRKNFIQERKQLRERQISGEEILQEIERLKSLAISMDIKLNKLTIDPRNTISSKSDIVESNKIDFTRQTLNFEICGNFLDIGNFIETIEEKSNKLKLQQCSISLDSLDPTGVLARIEYLTYGGLN